MAALTAPVETASPMAHLFTLFGDNSLRNKFVHFLQKRMILKHFNIKKFKRRTVAQALLDRGWVADIKGALILCLKGVSAFLGPDGQLAVAAGGPALALANQPTRRFFVGTIHFTPWNYGRESEISRTGSRADQLAKRGSRTQQPAHFVTRKWNRSNIYWSLVFFVFARQSNSTKLVPKDKKGLNALFHLVTWEIWKHRNACVLGSKPGIFGDSSQHS
ncbi:hypothetical protein U9M48_023308 [Paspalum notatum var. saurae]|uniref:Uncharacterized protein n=1 Tax=Paspalum notatum var. saurae TaxID=547442 RepID=A0AAQ3TLP6_PASNO